MIQKEGRQCRGNEMKIAIIGRMPAKGYSGGRYHAWVMAEALSQEENVVYVITNHVPEFSRDFEIYPKHERIRIVLTDDFYRIRMEDTELDYVICVPGIGMGKRFYTACWDFAVERKARFAFINFETPNWYRQYGGEERPEEDYRILRRLCRQGCLVFNSALESQKHAELYYNLCPERTQFCVWSPPINSLVADSVKEERKNQILIFLRVKDKHKGGDDFLELLGEYLRGVTCVCVVGTGAIPADFLEKAREAAQKYGIILKIEKSLSDYRKFEELKKSRLLIFSSHFEGYGYPPVEALYCGAGCIAYDLPVLREISGDRLHYCELGNITAMRAMLEKALSEEETGKICVETAEFGSQAIKLQRILLENLCNEKLMRHHVVLSGIFSYCRRFLYKNVVPLIFSHLKLVENILKDCIREGMPLSEYLDEKEEKRRKVKACISGKKVYIWGYGRAYKELYPRYIKGVEIEGILDRNKEKIGSYDILSGAKIESPDILRQQSLDDVAVLISNKANIDDIVVELKEMGIDNFHSLCMMGMNSVRCRIYRTGYWKKQQKYKK